MNCLLSRLRNFLSGWNVSIWEETVAQQAPTHQKRINKISALSIGLTEKKILTALVTVLAITQAQNLSLGNTRKN